MLLMLCIVVYVYLLLELVFVFVGFVFMFLLFDVWMFGQVGMFVIVQFGNLLFVGYFVVDGDVFCVVIVMVSIFVFVLGVFVCSLYVLWCFVIFVVQMVVSLFGCVVGCGIFDDGERYLILVSVYFVVFMVFFFGGGVGFVLDRIWVSGFFVVVVVIFVVIWLCVGKVGFVDLLQNNFIL